MSDLDDELRQAVKEGDDADHDVAESMVETASDAESSGSKRNLGLLIALLAIGGGALSLVLGSSDDSMVYDKKVHEVLAEGAAADGRTLNVEGFLVHGTLMKREQPCEYRFSLKSMDPSKTGEIKVHYPSCIVPDTFRDVAGMDVTVSAKGRFEGDVLNATHISTKCPTKYEMEQRKQMGEQAPHTEGTVPILSFDNEG